MITELNKGIEEQELTNVIIASQKASVIKKKK
jgi:hypothetical protein